MKHPLRITLASLRQGENRLRFELEPEELGLRDREVAENPLFELLVGTVRVDVRVDRSGRKLLVTGTVSFKAKLDCADCGEQFECQFNEPLSAEFLSCGAADELGADFDPREINSVHGDHLDLAELVRDAVHLAIPMAPKCRPDCHGLCPDCGVNLNTGQCCCQDKARVPGERAS